MRSMFAAAQQSVRVRGVGMLARMGASADGEAMGVRGAGGRERPHGRRKRAPL